jgi:hypothetical protein
MLALSKAAIAKNVPKERKELTKQFGKSTQWHLAV